MQINNLKQRKDSFIEQVKVDLAQPVSEAQRRLWCTFLTARIALSVVLLLIQVVSPVMTDEGNVSWTQWVMHVLFGAYFVETVVLRWRIVRGSLLERYRVVLWALTAGVDLLVFSWMYWSAADNSGYFMLFIFLVLMVAALGTRWMIYVTCTFISVFVFLRTGLFSLSYYKTSPFQLQALFQSLLAALGLFVIGELVHQLSERMRSETRRAFAGLVSAKQQEVLNRLIVSEMEVGVIVADEHARLKMFNPAAAFLIKGENSLIEESEAFEGGNPLEDGPGWKQLQEVVRILFDSAVSNRWLVFDFMLEQGNRGPSMLQIKGRVLESADNHEQKQCVLFLTDMRDVDRRMQQEKLAAMGRMSASIAHEIRNPLATIASANSLLAEGLHDKGSVRLSQMIATNADRLSRIVKDVLEVAHMEVGREVDTIDLLMALPEVVNDWVNANGIRKGRVFTQWPDDIFGVYIAFDEDHLRRVLVNLLDNAARYASDEDGAIFVICHVYQASGNELVRVSVYSDGQALSGLTEKSLFEPFFSTESRGTGLGLYICRNLCHRYGVSLDYVRTNLEVQGKLKGYNEFYITTKRVDPLPGETQVLLDQTQYQGE